MEGTGYAHAHHCSLQSGSSYCTQCALDVDAEASPPTSPAPSLQDKERGHHGAQGDLPLPRPVCVVHNDVDCKHPSMSPSHCSSNIHTESIDDLFHSAAQPLLLPSNGHQNLSSQCSPESRPSRSPFSAPSSRALDPDAREFSPPLQPSLQIAIHAPLNMAQPVYSAHSEIRVSLCYQTNVTAMQGPCNHELVDTNLRLGIPPEIVTANSNMDVSTHTQHVETGSSPFENMQGSQFVPCTGLAENYMGFGQHVNGSSFAAEGASQMGSIGFLTPVHDTPPMYNPPILANPHVGFLPPVAMPLPPPPPPPAMPPFIPLASSNGQPVTHPQQALAVYTHKHFHPQFGWKEHISRALVISGIPPLLTEPQLRSQLEQWGHIRALHTDKLPQGIISVQFFDLRASRQALRDMQNQHLLRQQRFQEHLYAQSGMQFHNYRFQFDMAAQGLSSRGLLCGHVVWAQYIAAWSVPVPDGHNQGTLVLFNVGADVSLQRLQQVFEKYGHVRELREAPTKRQHKFVEFYDVRDAEAAWTALNGQEVCGKCVKIEFSRQGGPVRKQKSVPVPTRYDMVAIGDKASNKDSAPCGRQSHSFNGYYQQEWHAKLFEGDPQPFPRPNMAMLPNTFWGPDDCPSYISSMGSEWYGTGGNDHVNLMQGEVAGPRRKHSIFRAHPKVNHALVHHGTDKAFATRSAGTIQRNVSTRGHPHFEYDEREVYLISGQPRTTLMIKNIPNKYSQQMLLSMLDHHCVEYNSQIQSLNEPESAYDFVYLPIDFKNRCNLGYAFVNFTSALATLKFFKAFHAQAWEEFNSRKICDIKYARVQGRHALENHFCNSRFACDTLEYLPVVFTPPRNGLECPPPRAAAGLMMMKSGRPGCAVLACPSGARATIFLSRSNSLPKSDPHEKPPPPCDISAMDNETEQIDSDNGSIPVHDVAGNLQGQN